jgi:hypothetical protein
MSPKARPTPARPRPRRPSRLARARPIWPHGHGQGAGRRLPLGVRALHAEPEGPRPYKTCRARPARLRRTAAGRAKPEPPAPPEPAWSAAAGCLPRFAGPVDHRSKWTPPRAPGCWAARVAPLLITGGPPERCRTWRPDPAVNVASGHLPAAPPRLLRRWARPRTPLDLLFQFLPWTNSRPPRAPAPMATRAAGGMPLPALCSIWGRRSGCFTPNPLSFPESNRFNLVSSSFWKKPPRSIKSLHTDPTNTLL